MTSVDGDFKQGMSKVMFFGGLGLGFLKLSKYVPILKNSEGLQGLANRIHGVIPFCLIASSFSFDYGKQSIQKLLDDSKSDVENLTQENQSIQKLLDDANLEMKNIKEDIQVKEYFIGSTTSSTVANDETEASPKKQSRRRGKPNEKTPEQKESPSKAAAKETTGAIRRKLQQQSDEAHATRRDNPKSWLPKQ